MARRHPHRNCKGCGKHRDENGGILSATGLCTDCGEERFRANLVQLVERSGPYHDHWLRRSFMVAYAGVLSLDDLEKVS